MSQLPEGNWNACVLAAELWQIKFVIKRYAHPNLVK
jgi:hypothetical protein